MRAYKAKSVERIELPDREARERHLHEAGYNVFNLDAEAVFVDLLTDSGTGAMSDEQWAAIHRGDESYAGSESFQNLEAAIEDVMGFSRIVPAHQGRGAENVLYGALVSEGEYVPNNTHFDTTRAHIVNAGGEPVDCPIESDPGDPFQGNLDTEAVRELANEVGAERIPAVVVTITNNSLAGQPVSIANLREARAVADELDARLVIDACRFAENAYFVAQREAEFDGESVASIAREQLSMADAIVMSGKKDGLANVGGFVGVRENDDEFYEQARQRGILFEGFSTYGGMAGRDLEAMAVGLREAVERPYIESRVEQVAELGTLLQEVSVPIRTPTGGHAVYVDAGEFLPSIPREEFPGQALVCALYEEGGVRAVELGELAFPGEDRAQLVRLCLPRRTYFRDHLEHVAETFATVADRREELPGYEIVDEPAMAELRHFSAELRPLD
ncbi:tryptophanase/L-cysteine desulfhydrase, PLP-dependent [Halococcus morrhuae DSM 1307]|uniref:Tryptophanase/L-cysteine desulfhydrase, PLP-dependent n=1 Tax=Halococcus morrhuae DSM 1307 TaxID=931277 RepID=M0M7A1_HALMO|nr:tryptophanase [Halococcus morrhuae]EMA40255.1 tryptophanase/L-cysteine desulfhydrase, PLP-dependent [Halococcus morrhuae DSM 1307]